MFSKVDQGKGSTGRAGKVGFNIQAKAVKYGCYQFRWFDRTFGRHSADRITAADNPATLDSATGVIRCPALRPMISAAPGVGYSSATQASTESRTVIERT